MHFLWSCLRTDLCLLSIRFSPTTYPANLVKRLCWDAALLRLTCMILYVTFQIQMAHEVFVPHFCVTRWMHHLLNHSCFIPQGTRTHEKDQGQLEQCPRAGKPPVTIHDHPNMLCNLAVGQEKDSFILKLFSWDMSWFQVCCQTLWEIRPLIDWISGQCLTLKKWVARVFQVYYRSIVHELMRWSRGGKCK